MKTPRSPFKEVGKVIKHSLTLNDNQTYDPGTVAFIVSIFVTCYLAFHSVVFQGRDPHLQDLGVALAAIVAAFGAYKKLDPDPTTTPTHSTAVTANNEPVYSRGSRPASSTSKFVKRGEGDEGS